MSFLNPGLLAGLAFVAVPIILHFMLRAKPKKLMFPALRLIQQRRMQNVQRMRLRHIWLLLLRMLAIALLVFALVRPSLPAANYGLNLYETIMLLFLIAAAIGAYFGCLWYWKKQSVPRHQMDYRKTWLKTGTIGGFVLLSLLAVAWPYQRRVFAEVTAPAQQVAESFPVAAVMLFDTSLSMDYTQENKTRLAYAGEIALGHLENLPETSRVAIADTTKGDPILFQTDLNAAVSRLSRSDGIATSAISVPIDARIKAAIRLQEEDRKEILDEIGASEQEAETTDGTDDGKEIADRFMREIYIFTDLAQTSWNVDAADSLNRELARVPWLNVYIIDVGVEQPLNLGVTEITLSSETGVRGRPVFLEVKVESASDEVKETHAELYTTNTSGDLIKQGQENVQVSRENAARLFFSLTNLAAPVTHGEVRLVSSDPFGMDDIRHFSIGVQPPAKVLLVGDQSRDLFEWEQALSPDELARQNRVNYVVAKTSSAAFNGLDLSEYRAVCMINASKPNDETWDKLLEYVQSGGGLFVALGSTRIDSLSYDGGAATELLPAIPTVHARFQPPEYVDTTGDIHAISRKLGRLNAQNVISSLDIRRHWKVKPNMPGSVVFPFSDVQGSPAIVERTVGRGKVMMMLTAVDLRNGSKGRNWSDLARGGWAYMALADFMMRHLTGQAEERYNFTTGETVELSVSPPNENPGYLLRMPGFRQAKIEVPYVGPNLSIRSRFNNDAPANNLAGRHGIIEPGSYDLVPDEPNAPVETGFAVNIPASESRFERLPVGELDRFFGEDRYQVATNVDELERQVNQGRIGKEIYPVVLALMLLAFCGEHFIANHFYDTEE